MTTKNFRQEFELEVDCKKISTAFKKFAKKYPEAWEGWGSSFEEMDERNDSCWGGLDHGWTLWLEADEYVGYVYMCIVITDESYKI